MITGTTKTGFKFSVDPDAMRDMEVLELLADATEDGSKMPKFLTALLGATQRKALYDHVRNANGRVLFEAVEAETTDIFDALKGDGETKN